MSSKHNVNDDSPHGLPTNTTRTLSNVQQLPASEARGLLHARGRVRPTRLVHQTAVEARSGHPSSGTSLSPNGHSGLLRGTCPYNTGADRLDDLRGQKVSLP